MLIGAACAACHGAAVARPGAEGARCARPGDARCADGLYCYRHVVPAGVRAEPAVCRVRPTACTDFYQPVCAEDGKIYDNACKAASAGVNQAMIGACAGMMREAPPTP